MANQTGVCVWNSPKMTGEVPEPRSGHSFNILGRRAFIIGGCGNVGGKGGFFNDVYQLELSPDAINSSKLSTSGTPPSPRWGHTATVMSDTKLIVFGGLDKTTRYNDCFMLDVETNTWTELQMQGPVPAPRAHHTANVIGRQYVVFGGYGGYGGSRTFFGDVHTLDLDTLTWTKQAPKGNAPRPRADHSASIVEAKFLVILGGRDSTQHFDDVCVLEFDTMEWSKISASPPPEHPIALCNHVGEAIESVPNYKIFTFGGQCMKERTEWHYTNNVRVHDTGSMVWVDVETQGLPPIPREDMQWAFDSKTAKMYLFGGWADQWLNDLFTLDVSGIVGPPYACTGVVPALGPVTGATTVTVQGINFPETANVSVKFVDARGEESVSGTWVSASEIECATPNFEKHGAGDVEIRVSCGGLGFTVNRIKFSYFVNTRANKCLAFGPGVLEEGTWGTPMIFVIQAKDATGRNRTSGGDPFVVTVASAKNSELPVQIKDNEDGTYEVSYIAPCADDFVVQVNLEGQAIRGSPFNITFKDPWTRPRVAGPGPRLREDYICAAMGKKVVFFGGESQEVHILDTDSWKWSQPKVTGKPPLCRRLHTITHVNDKMYVIGGQTVRNKEEFERLKNEYDELVAEGKEPKKLEKFQPQLLNDVAVFVADRDTFSWFVANDVGGPQPVGRMKQSAVGYGPAKKLFMFGGEGAANTQLDSMHYLNTSNDLKLEWADIVATGTVPTPRSGAPMVYSDSKIYLVGGSTGEECSSELFVGHIDRNTCVWESVEVAGDKIEPGRSGHMMEVMDNKVYIYGGQDPANNYLDELFVLDPSGETPHLRKIYASDGSHYNHRPFAVMLNKKLICINSVGGSANSLDDIQVIDIAALTDAHNFLPKIGLRVTKELRDMEKFMSQSTKTLELKLNEGDTNQLLKIMGVVHEIKHRQPEVDLQFEVLREAVSFLKRSGVTVDRNEKSMDDAQHAWNNVKKVAPTVRDNIKPHQEKEAHRIKSDLAVFTERVSNVQKEFQRRDFYKYSCGAEQSYALLEECHLALTDYEKELGELSALAELFEFPECVVEAATIAQETRDDLTRIKQLWDIIFMVLGQLETWNLTLWNDINTDYMEEEAKRYLKELRSLHKNARTCDAYSSIDQNMKNFLVSLPLIHDLHDRCMRERHWDKIKETTKVDFEITEEFKLDDLLKLKLHEFEDDVNEIVNKAQKEEKMETTLNKMEEIWSGLMFEFVGHKDTPLKLVKIAEENHEALEEHQVQIQNMMASPNLPTFETQVLKWHKNLATIADVVQILSEIQRTWSYLETLFIGSDEVKKELPNETVLFASIDEEVKEVLQMAGEIKNVLETCTSEGLYKRLENTQTNLEECEKALAKYLEDKRTLFPRFFFVSTSDLLDILSNGNRPANIMVHMPKIFQAIQTLDLQTSEDPNERPTANGLTSSVGKEYVQFSRPLQLEGQVESYLAVTITTIASSLRGVLTDAVHTYTSKDRSDWIFEYPNQVVLVGTQLWWAAETEVAFKDLQTNKEALTDYSKKQVDQLIKCVKLVQGDLDRSVRQKVMCVITMDTHQRDIVLGIIRDDIRDASSFVWQSQLRYRWDDVKNDCFINICDAEFQYGFEYLGNGPRLVITPLTDRIYVTATQSLHLCMGCAPAGPAGTGKTETTKDLASAVGKAVYVFNCSDQMDYRSMGDIFKGLASSGAWGCFDEFNRLVAEVLSVCSTQFRAVVDAIREKRATFVLQGSEMTLDPTCGVYITMNPGYLGRTELPESLKTLFRPLTVVVPDLELICENMLMAEGFVDAKPLARKFVTLYALLRDLLSKQDHYDWGLRAIKSVLVVAGSFKRAEPDQAEQGLLMRALRDFNLPKIVADDLVVFYGLLGDLFPGVNLPRKRDLDLERVIEDVTKESDLEPEEEFILKVVQLSELLAIRHCVFVLGSSGAGKSECWKMLGKAKTKLGDKTIVRDLNPKAISTNELYGFIQMSTREWKDGLLSCIMRDLANMPDTNPKWIILDGDLDANWIESMNSVMDDNKILTLASNERIMLLPHMRLIFEIRDLKYATPATVSRAGILYISDGKQWDSYVRSWIKKHVGEEHPSRAEKLQELFEQVVPETLMEMRKSFKTLIPIFEFNMVQTLCHLLEGLLVEDNFPADQDEKKLLEHYFVFAAVWAFGSATSVKDGYDFRKSFSNWWKSKWNPPIVPKFPKGTVFEYYVDKKTCKFNPWTQVVQEITYTPGTPMGDITVPTPETTSLSFFMNLLVDLQHPVMLVGSAGSGKTQLVQGMLKQLPEELMYLTINFNYYTDSLSLQKMLEAPLEKKAGRNFGPPGTKRLVFFVDDLNLPMLDPYNTQTPIALLRQHFDYGTWYDRAKLSLKAINKCQYISCMNPTAGSFVINPRLQRHFATFAVGFPAQESLMTIYSTFLNGHLASFDPTVLELSNKVIQAALELHSKVSSTFRKTAVNFHYEFNIRHLANVFQGLLLSAPEHFTNPVKLAALWAHESERVYGDRLVSEKDLQAYIKAAKEVGKKFFKDFDISAVFPEPLVFCNFAGGLDDHAYNMVDSFEVLNTTLEEALRQYNEMNASMNLVLFQDAMKHVCRISRIIKTGHALLVGVGGMGKQSLARLSAFICEYQTMQISISGTYGVNDLKEDLKVMYTKSGLKSEQVLFLFTDSQVTDEKFLVFINDLLASGNIADLFPGDEKENIINAVRSEVKSLGMQDTRENCYDFFISRVRENLHMALCFSPVGDAFRRRALRFPALVNCTVIDWFQPWPEEALHSVAKRFLSTVDMGTEEIKTAVVLFMPTSFQVVNKLSLDYLRTSRRYNYTTPKSFLELITLFKTMLDRQRKNLTDAIERLGNGLTKLQTTSRDVAILEDDLKAKQVKVEEKKEAADALMKRVGTEKAKVGGEAEKAAIEAANCEVVATEVGIKREDCMTDLAKAEPAVAAAEEALNTLNKRDLGELKSLAKPPAGVDDITACVLVLFSGNGPPVKDRTWGAAKLMMKNVDKFMQQLKDFKGEMDAQKVLKTSVDACRPYIALEHFNRASMFNKSKAAAGLCDWVLNIVIYYDILTDVEPKRRMLAQAESDLEAAEVKLTEVKQQVAELQEQLATLEAEFDEAVREKNEVVAEAEKCAQKLNLAQRLVNALASENVRWAKGIEDLKASMEVLIGDVLLSSAFVSYVGCFNKGYRDQLLNNNFVPFLTENKIPMSETADPLLILCDDAQIAGWNSEGLPSDRVSIENGAIVMSCERWPLLIDPQLQGIAWIKEREARNNLEIVRLGQKKLLPAVERAMENGWSVMIENLGESIDAVLAPVIGRQTIKKGRSFYIKLGDKEVEYTKGFRLFLHTKLNNPHYPPEIQAETTLINFTVTEAGLEDQLLALVVRKERPDLEEQKAELIKQQNGFKIKLKELEDNLLHKLANATGEILEDVELIENLEDTKRIATEIEEKVAIAKHTEIEINKARECYRFIAKRGALLFFLLNDLFKINSFYYYSLNAYVVVFERALASAGKTDAAEDEEAAAVETGNPYQKFKSLTRKLNDALELDDRPASASKEVSPEELEERLGVLMEAITFVVFNFVRRGLFEKHKLIVAIQLTFLILARAGNMNDAELEYLLQGKKATAPPAPTADVASFTTESSWAACHALKELPAFAKFCDDLDANAKLWKAWASEEKPENVELPGSWNELTRFQTLLVLRALRPDRLMAALDDFVRENLGPKFVEQDPFNAEEVYNESSSSTPLFFILFPGADVLKDIEPIMRKFNMTIENGRLVNISMGQGQEPIAEKALDLATQDGGWVLLQNVHLMQSWLPVLETKLEQSAEKAHPNFRCLLSAEPPSQSHIKTIPEAIMQSAVKIANEPPQDVKANLQRAWSNFSQAFLDKCNKPKEFRTTLFALCFFHSMVLGRRKFGPQGWSRPYSFNTGDLTICGDVLYNYLQANDEVPWADLRYLFGEIMYGGHITDYWDRRTNSTYLEVLVRPELFNRMELAPQFKALVDGSYDDFKKYIETDLPRESPLLFGLHPNAEIGFLTTQADVLFATIVDLQGSAGGSGGASKDEVIAKVLDSLLDQLPGDFNMIDINSKVQEKTPFVVVVLQECDRMNLLLSEIRRSLNEVKLGLEGALNISEAMEAISNAIFINRVPDSWAKVAYPSLKGMAEWFANLLERVQQLIMWSTDLLLPRSVWISGLFNPMAFLTAIMQVTARAKNFPLDQVAIDTEITTKLTPDELEGLPEDGAYIHGLFLQGARWDTVSGQVKDSFLKDLNPSLPVVHVRGIPVAEKKNKGYYQCPVYITAQRGPTYTFVAYLKTSEAPSKWTLAGLAALMNVE